MATYLANCKQSKVTRKRLHLMFNVKGFGIRKRQKTRGTLIRLPLFSECILHLHLSLRIRKELKRTIPILLLPPVVL